MSPLSDTRISVVVTEADIDVGRETDTCAAGDRSVGAVVSFVGLVRDLNLAADVVALELEHYPGMTEKALQQIGEEAALRWPLNAVRIVHRVGKLHPGDRIVMVLTASAHRQAAFESCNFVMDYLKTRAPFWKKEWNKDGAKWVEARESDTTAAERWHQLVAEHFGNLDHD
ncbi:molybdopterin synthase catalytic subunit MoaE [Chitinimonas sp. BJYL2]|uniref:molybdopterin synthase catalytic subunit MoaE n=1 Tax=Chitinimonas sp. BJYL2 TaxID=2976696 RepID=UPI0022B38DD3|nr:molybdopterin synthase catalytic subunit MoaE [Chitinimonas sp. BJYL2]